MKGILNAVSAHEIGPNKAALALAPASASAKPYLVSPETISATATATIASQKLSQILTKASLVGAVTGCLAGFIALPCIPGREALFLLMLPLGGAFSGMGAGFLSVIGFNQFARWQETVGSRKELPERKGQVQTIFASHEDGGKALAALTEAGVKASRISVIGEDCDSFRQATSSLQSKRLNKQLICMGLLGGFIGSLAAFAGMPALTQHVANPLISTVSAVLGGLVLGVYTGVAIGGMMILDGIPDSEAHFQLGTLDQGAMAVSVVTTDQAEEEMVRNLISQQAVSCRLALKD